MDDITQEFVRSLFYYRDGELFWKVKLNLSIEIGSKAGTLNKITGYYLIGINRKQYYTHRLIFLYHNGYLPRSLDHIDRNKQNNQIENLRGATQSQNCMNRTPHKNTSSIYKGVSWVKHAKKWSAHIQINNKLKHLGYFKSETAAAIAYNDAAIKHFGEYANLNVVNDNYTR